MSGKLQGTLEASGIEWAALWNYVPCMAQVIKLAWDAFISSLSENGSTKSWEAHAHNQQFGEIESIDIGKSQRLPKVGNARINEVSAMEPGLAKIFVRLYISRYFESPETNLHIVENGCCIDCGDTWPSNWVHWLSKSQSLHRGSNYYGCKDMLEFDTGVAWVSPLITKIHLRVAAESKVLSIPATLDNTGWMDHCQLWNGSCEAIPTQDPVDVEEAYSHISSRYHSLPGHIGSDGWCYASLSIEEDIMQGRLVLRREVSATEAVQILYWIYSNDWYASPFSTFPQSFLAVANV